MNHKHNIEDYIKISKYIEHGFTKECLKDSCALVRLAGYNELGFNEEALHDSCDGIREAAKLYFKCIEDDLYKQFLEVFGND